MELMSPGDYRLYTGFNRAMQGVSEHMFMINT